MPLDITPIDHSADTSPAPIDRDFSPGSLDVAFVPITTAAREDDTDRPHEKLLLPQKTITTPGYGIFILATITLQWLRHYAALL